MKKTEIFTLIALIFSFVFYAQGGRMKEKKEQIQSLKIAFISNKLSLTPEEAEKFWPVYNAFNDRQFDIRNQKTKLHLKRMDEEYVDKLTEKEAYTIINQMESMDEDIYINRKKFFQNLKGMISPNKILKLRRAEEDFNKKLLEQYKGKRMRD